MDRAGGAKMPAARADASLAGTAWGNCMEGLRVERGRECSRRERAESDAEEGDKITAWGGFVARGDT